MPNIDRETMMPTLMPLGQAGLLVRFGTHLSDTANRAGIAFAQLVADRQITGVIEIVPNLVSVLLRYDPSVIGFETLAGEVRLLASLEPVDREAAPRSQVVPITYGGKHGPDLDEIALALHLAPQEFIRSHLDSRLRVLATGFAPGFVYCGFHEQALVVPRRPSVRSSVPPGAVLFAAGQSAIAATTIPTGWHWIGTTSLRNFDPRRTPPTELAAGDQIQFIEARP